MTWDYRVTRRDYAGEIDYAIREVYYDDNDKIVSWTVDEIAAAGANIEEVKDALQRMLEACDKPVLDITDEDNPKEITQEEAP
jgi:hypothetical protein